MKRHQGSAGLSVIECINPRLQKYRVRWDLREEEEGGVSFLEMEFGHKPTLDEVKDIITTWMNSEIDAKIVSEFVWKDMPIWLSTENQFNYKAAYDLAVQTNGANLPIKFKFGTTAEPVYYTFETVLDLQDFYVQAMSFINNTLNEGWEWKDSYDWTAYEEALV